MAALSARRGNGLFVEDGRPPILGSSVKSPTSGNLHLVPRNGPLLQSSSDEDSSSEGRKSEDPLTRKLRKETKASREADRKKGSERPGTSILQKKKDVMPSASKTATNSMSTSETGLQRLNISTATTKPASSTRSEKDRTVVSTATTSKTTDSAVSEKGGKAIRTAPQKQTSRTINFVDQPRDQQRQWSTDNHYNKLKIRGLADKRSRTEGTPDFSALNFVNGPPPTLPKTAPRSSGDLYGRRDISTKRVQEEDPDDRPRLGQGLTPLADWEKDKVPLMCNDWKLSSNCPYGARNCRFMHRTHDPQNQPYRLGDMYNRTPHKYRDPPITCSFWYNGDRCMKTAEECQYAHEDTGWTEINGQPIEREHLPHTSAGPTIQEALPQRVPYKLQNPPITCTFWLRGPQGCSKAEAACQYAHRNTGWAPPEDNFKAPAVPINKSLQPRWTAPKHAEPSTTYPTRDKNLTCISWLRDPNGCSKSEEACANAHWNTGWATPRGRPDVAPVPLDPNQMPRSHREPRYVEPLQHPPKLSPNEITCRHWLNASRGCTKSEIRCHYVHRNTGWYMPWLPDLHKNGKPERIDLNQKPVFRQNGKCIVLKYP